MVRLVVIVLAIMFALARGGSVLNLGRLELRMISLALLGFVLQIVVFTPIGQPLHSWGIVPWVYVLSMLLLVAWMIANWRLAGMPLMGAGLLANSVVIIANGGYMPVGIEQAQMAGRLERYAAVGMINNNSILLPVSEMRLWFLADIVALPASVPFANVFSVGDILLSIGIALLCYRATRYPPQVGQLPVASA